MGHTMSHTMTRRFSISKFELKLKKFLMKAPDSISNNYGYIANIDLFRF